MKMALPALLSLEKAMFRIAALVLSRLQGGNIRAELHRLGALPKSRSYVQVGGVLAVLFALALLAASFGVLGLLIYFAGAVLLFR